MSRIVYALPAFSVFFSEYNRCRINAVVKKGQTWLVTDVRITIEKLTDTYDQNLLNNVQQSSPAPPSNSANYMFNLEPRATVSPFRLS